MTRPPIIRASYLNANELVIDNFAGGGGASSGIEAALGRPVDIAINHDAEAIAMHRANHPETRHYRENVWAVDPVVACAGRPVGLAWFSPACTHYSRARGAQNPRSAEIRSLAWVVIRWARAVKPRIIVLENVEEFADWGRLDNDGKPIKELAGKTFQLWVNRLRGCGYAVEWRSLVAADYGAPTTRRRLFLVARSDGQPITWPEATHGKGRANAWRQAAEIIDWSLPCASIFARKRPLAEATLRRIARGIQRFVIESADPFVIPVTHQGDERVHSVREPLRTITAAHRGELALIAPYLVRHGHYSTITGAGLDHGKGCGTFRGQQLSLPLSTVCATNDKHLVCPILTKHYGDPDRASGGGAVVGQDLRRAIGTVTARDHHALTMAFLTKFYGTSTGARVGAPVPTITGKGQHIGLVTVRGENYAIADIGMRMLQPNELFAAQGFPSDYDISPEIEGKSITKTAQIRLAGNSVCPDVAQQLVAANVRAGERRAA